MFVSTFENKNINKLVWIFRLWCSTFSLYHSKLKVYYLFGYCKDRFIVLCKFNCKILRVPDWLLWWWVSFKVFGSRINWPSTLLHFTIRVTLYNLFSIYLYTISKLVQLIWIWFIVLCKIWIDITINNWWLLSMYGLIFFMKC